jgi:hypothetical protein
VVLEGCAVICVQWQPLLDARREIGICNEPARERNQISNPFFDDCFGAIGIKAIHYKNVSFEDFPELLGCDRAALARFSARPRQHQR